MDTLLPELLHLIAGEDMTVYYGLIRAYPKFARLITNGIRFDYAIRFGVNCHITQNVLAWTMNKRVHRADGPAVVNCITGEIQYFINEFPSTNIL